MDTARLEFLPYDGDLMGLAVTPNHIVFRWNVDFCTILFSMTKQGRSANIHFASNKQGLRYIKEAVDKFVRFVFSTFDWCRMVTGNVGRPSIGRLIEKVGFIPFADCDKGTFYMRLRDELC